jgi:hypothetical protein
MGGPGGAGEAALTRMAGGEGATCGITGRGVRERAVTSAHLGAGVGLRGDVARTWAWTPERSRVFPGR